MTEDELLRQVRALSAQVAAVEQALTRRFSRP